VSVSLSVTLHGPDLRVALAWHTPQRGAAADRRLEIALCHSEGVAEHAVR